MVVERCHNRLDILRGTESGDLNGLQRAFTDQIQKKLKSTEGETIHFGAVQLTRKSSTTAAGHMSVQDWCSCNDEEPSLPSESFARDLHQVMHDAAVSSFRTVTAELKIPGLDTDKLGIDDLRFAYRSECPRATAGVTGRVKLFRQRCRRQLTAG